MAMGSRDQEIPSESAPTVETWDDADCRLQVSQPEGWTCKVRLRPKIPRKPLQIFSAIFLQNTMDWASETKMSPSSHLSRSLSIEWWEFSVNPAFSLHGVKFLWQVKLQTRIYLPPDELFELLTQPDNSKVFRNIKVGWAAPTCHWNSIGNLVLIPFMKTLKPGTSSWSVHTLFHSKLRQILLFGDKIANSTGIWSRSLLSHSPWRVGRSWKMTKEAGSSSR